MPGGPSQVQSSAMVVERWRSRTLEGRREESLHRAAETWSRRELTLTGRFQLAVS